MIYKFEVHTLVIEGNRCHIKIGCCQKAIILTSSPTNSPCFKRVSNSSLFRYASAMLTKFLLSLGSDLIFSITDKSTLLQA
jgi:hypothetical protein